jgi:hypothetical protein
MGLERVAPRFSPSEALHELGVLREKQTARIQIRSDRAAQGTPDMLPFPDAAHAASWAGLAPGNNQSGGKRRSGRTNKGNRWLRRALVQSAWAVSHKSNCFLTAQFYRRAARQGEKKAIVATAHQLLVIAFYILRDGTVYREKGGNYFDQLNPERTKRKLVVRLERMGFDVILRNSTSTPVPSPSVPPPSARRRGRPCKCVERGIDCNLDYAHNRRSERWPYSADAGRG